MTQRDRVEDYIRTCKSIKLVEVARIADIAPATLSRIKKKKEDLLEKHAAKLEAALISLNYTRHIGIEQMK